MRSDVQLVPGPPLDAISSSGAVAQLGERELCKLEVVGSIPVGSTSLRRLAVTARQATQEDTQKSVDGLSVSKSAFL